MSSATPGPGRILYVTDGFAPFVVGGMQTYARRQIETLVAAGWEVISISSRGDVPADLPWRNIVLPWPARSGLGRFSPWRYVNDLRQFSRRVTPLIDDVAPDIVYAEGPLIDDYLSRPDRPAPAIFNPHGLEMFQPKGSLIDDLKSLPLRGIVADHALRSDATICLSGGQLMNILRDRTGMSEARIAVVANAAPHPAATIRTGQSGEHRFLFVGRDEPRKALPLLLRAFRALDGARLDVVGATGTAPGVHFHGEVRDPARVREAYVQADFLVVPSHAEGMPTVILEAFAMGLPVIATDVGASAAMVLPGKTGFLIPRADGRALRAAMREAMALPSAAYSAMSHNCLEMARNRFSADSARDALLALLDGLRKTNKSD